ncbi:MAG: uroporphyrin-3 C-methyltransferase [Porticoccaceae bacterium]|jgi:uroporphyrin-3 C-methyltransferase|tara:strand:- start:15260 stop:16450 length:1191 start_codon:yes stop_codon:yes gene_type:complete
MKMSESEEKAQALSNSRSKAATKKAQSTTEKTSSAKPLQTKRSASSYLWLLLGLTVLLTIITGSWFGWQQWQSLQSKMEQIEGLSVALDEQLQRSDSQDIAASNRELKQVEKNQNLSQQMMDLQLQLNAQGARITELGSTTRTDWYLSEAAYLARLASQRLQTERSTKNPLALLQKVDSILVELNEAGMLAVRAAIASDITTLRLAGEIDVEGIVLELNALTAQIDQLSMIQLSVPVPDINQALDSNDSVNGDVNSTLSQRWSNLVDKFSQSLGQLVQVKQRVEPIERVLSTSEESIVRNNLRLLLQQAANAALREQQTIYDLSLKRAQQWVAQYFQMNSSVQVVKNRLIDLSGKQVVQQLPLIDGSVNALEAFMIIRQSSLLEASEEAVTTEELD